MKVASIDKRSGIGKQSRRMRMIDFVIASARFNRDVHDLVSGLNPFIATFLRATNPYEVKHHLIAIKVKLNAATVGFIEFDGIPMTEPSRIEELVRVTLGDTDLQGGMNFETTFKPMIHSCKVLELHTHSNEELIDADAEWATEACLQWIAEARDQSMIIATLAEVYAKAKGYDND